ncbi:hypothetical protein GGR51DRAFT_562352 [Nemania sp. FL0031]|nr:hypothetical protein GGR51DRAFT_562352 [Nemania sp. FL0031]
MVFHGPPPWSPAFLTSEPMSLEPDKIANVPHMYAVERNRRRGYIHWAIIAHICDVGILPARRCWAFEKRRAHTPSTTVRLDTLVLSRALDPYAHWQQISSKLSKAEL